MAHKSNGKGSKSLSIKKGDTVKVIAGRDKGAEGKVISVLREEQRVIVEGVNRVKRHTKVVNQGGRAGNTGGIITAEAPIHISNVILVDGKDVTRIGFRRDPVTKRRPDGSEYTAERSVRISRTTGGIITTEAPIHVSNVMLVDGKGVTRIGFRRDEVTKRRSDGSTYTAHRSVRVSRKTGKEI
jgi:large subunit ribosomal protein L24